MNRIDTLFLKLRGEKRPALMPFITAGDPDLAATALRRFPSWFPRPRICSKSAFPIPTRSRMGL